MRLMTAGSSFLFPVVPRPFRNSGKFFGKAGLFFIVVVLWMNDPIAEHSRGQGVFIGLFESYVPFCRETGRQTHLPPDDFALLDQHLKGGSGEGERGPLL